MSTTTFSLHRFVPDGRDMLACSCLLPDGWVNVPVPDETVDFGNPAVFLPVAVAMAPWGAVVFTIAARPAFDDGSVQDWAEYLAGQQAMRVERVAEARINRMPCILVDATMASDAGPMRSRSVFLEDGGRLFNLGALAPEAIWASVQPDFDRLLGSFALDEVRGITATPLREMTSAPAIDLSAGAAEQSDAGTTAAAPTAAAAAPTAAPQQASDADPAADEPPLPDDRPAQPADVALADDAASLDPEHEINARLRDNGVGLVPRVLMVSTPEKFAVVGAGAIESSFHLPFGWHVIDDGKRTLVFDPDGSVQINLGLRRAEDGPTGVLEGIGDDLARDHPQALFMKLEIMGWPCLAVRDLLIDGASLDQAYLARAAHREGLALVCRVTADRANVTRAMDTAEVVLTSLRVPASPALQSSEAPVQQEPEPPARQASEPQAMQATASSVPPVPPPEESSPPDGDLAGKPDWWRTAVLLEHADRLEEAERAILDALDHIGVYSSLAYLYEVRMGRLLEAGRHAEAKEAKARAIRWLYAYAGSATSGGEGAALSLERDQRIAALGGEDPEG